MNKIDLSNRVSIVTGGAQGFGLAIVKRFLQSGAEVIIWDKDKKLLEELKSGKISDRRDHVLIRRLSLLALSTAIFFSRWASTNGPFLNDLGTVYFLFKIYLSVLLFFLVLFSMFSGSCIV